MVRHTPVRPDDVQALRSRTIAFINGVVHLFDQNRKREVQIQTACGGDGDTFFVILMLLEQNAFFHITVHLPAVRRMCLLDIDHEELDVRTVAAVNSVQAPYLGPEGRSGVATKDQGYRPLAPETREAHPVVGSEPLEIEIRRVVASLRSHLISRYHGLQGQTQ